MIDNERRRVRWSRTGLLRRTVAAEFPSRPFDIVLWDGTRIPGTEPGPTFVAHSPQALTDVLYAPGFLGLLRAYVRGTFEISDLDALAGLEDWAPPELDGRARARLLAAAAWAGGVRPPLPPLSAELQTRGMRHSAGRDRRAVRHHYDVSNEFFALFLDQSMTYSCAFFGAGARTLEEAQTDKLELVCRKLALAPGHRVLDIGCGWGSFVIHAARHHGVSALGITLSPAQAELARRRVEAAGVADRVEIEVMDYRRLGDRRFDAVASIGMVEHVGIDQLGGYAAAVAGALAPGGVVLNHGICWIEPRPYEPSVFLRRFVFPDGELPHVSQVVDAFQRAGLEPLHLEGLRDDYAETLRHWIARLDEHRAEAVRLIGPERVRVWRLYLRNARTAFEWGRTSVFQLLCRRPAAAAAHPRVPYAAPARERVGVA